MRMLAVGMVMALVAAGRSTAEPVEYVKVEVLGTLQTGVAAPGGETTGVVVRAAGFTYELDLGRNKELRDKLATLNGKRVVVAGNLSLRRGISAGPRHVLVVSSLQGVDP